jgi:hypothetical protein
MNSKLIDIALEIMDPKAFEDLVYALVGDEYPAARQLTAPDAGRDRLKRLPGAESVCLHQRALQRRSICSPTLHAGSQ